MENGRGWFTNRGRTGLVLWYCFISLENCRIILWFFLLNLNFTQAWELFEPGIYTCHEKDGKLVRRTITLLAGRARGGVVPVQEHAWGDRFKNSRLLWECRGGLRHHWSTPAPAIKAPASWGPAPSPQPYGEFQEVTLPCGQLGNPALLNPAVIFLTCPQSLNYCCSKHTITLLPQSWTENTCWGYVVPPSWLGITPTVCFLAIFPPE